MKSKTYRDYIDDVLLRSNSTRSSSSETEGTVAANNTLVSVVNTCLAELDRLRRENDELKLYEKYYNTIFASNPKDKNPYFDNLKILFTQYMIPDSELTKDARELKYQLYAFVIFIANYIKEDEFYGLLLRHMLYNSKNFSNNLKDYSKLDDIMMEILDGNKLLKEVISNDEVMEDEEV